jgi:WD40 repeat protein/energy-coupling factor transporter ATP-binding protein EcfA2
MSTQANQTPGTTSIDVSNPFPGLRPFKIEESHLFFGREGQSDEVLLKLSKSRFVGVIGPSGSGKSSFIYCGVLPILYGGFLTDASPNWQVVVTRPGAGPVDNLAESLLKTSEEYNGADPEERKIKRTIVSTLLRSSSLGLVEAIQQSRRSEDVNYLVLVDQFEELFRFKDSTDPNSVNETLAFINLLMEAVNYGDSNIYVAITMRSDFIGECAQFPELTRKINDSHYLIPQMTRDQKRRAIDGPVAVGGAKIAPRLTQQLLNDLGDNPDQLPILQHALMRTWSYWTRFKDYEDEPVDLKHYEAIGTMSEALSMHANEAYDELEDDQKRICEVLFKAITEKRGENFGIRRPTRLNEIAAIADVSEADVIAVLDKFREQGRSLLTPAYGTPMTSRAMVDISHESLMRIWTRLKNWVDDEADAVIMYQRLAEAAAQYQVGKSGLWRPPDLQLALNWQAKHKPTLVWGGRYHPAFERTMIFLEYSKKEFETEQRIKELEQKRKLRNARITAIVLGTATVVSLMFLVFAFYQQTIAVANAKLAEENAIKANEAAVQARAAETEATKQRDAAEEQRQLAEEQRQAAVKAREDADRAKEAAIANELRAKVEEARANEQADIAKKNELKAQEQTAIATEQEAKARRERYLATARSMALKSKELNNDPELQAIVAQQAYNFNTTWTGYPYEDAVFNGLYKALTSNQHPLTADLTGHEKGAARAMVTHPRSKRIFSAGSDGRVLEWSSSNGVWNSKELVKSAGLYQYFSMDITQDESLLVVGGLTSGDASKNYIEVHNLRSPGSEPKKITGFTQSVEHLEITPDGKGAYVRDNSGKSIKFTDFNTVREVISIPGRVSAFALSADGKKIAGAGVDGVLYLWDTDKYAPVEVYKNPTKGASFTALAFSPDHEKIVVGDDHGIVRIVTIASGVASDLTGHRAHIEQVKFNFAGTFVATTSRDKTVRLWNWLDQTRQPIVLEDNPDWVWCATFTPDDEQLLVGVHANSRSAGKTIHVWPTNMSTMSGILCDVVKRNMTSEEWETYVAKDLNKERTCPSLPVNDK